MRPPADWAKRIAPALALLGLHATAAHGSRSGIETTLGAPPLASEVCESRTINYITHSLPQQCLRTSWNAPTPTASDNVIVEATAVPTSATTLSGSPEPTQHNATQPAPQDSPEELAASSFMSFEEWKEMMLRKSGQDPANIKTHKQREHHAERDPALNHGDVDTFGEEGEISLDFDALTEKVSEMASAASGGAAPPERQDVKEEQILYDDGKTQYYRSKDAGKTCKERFSYSSFDAGATVLKTSSGAKNAKAILVENKDSYMLLECRTKNKFVIVELSDDILVDTVVLANFEFFSSMIRKFRVSASDRYPVKMDKWVDLGTFEARNSRDIQAFLIEHPQIYTKYIRVEFLSHWGNEFYCPVSLLRVHGTRMLDTWKEPSHDDEPEQLEGAAREPAADTQSVPEAPPSNDFATAAKEESTPEVVTEVGLTPWQPIFQGNISLGICAMRSPTTAEPTPVTSGSSNPHNKAAGDADTAAERPSAATGIGGASQSSNSSSPAAASPQSPAAQGQATSSAPSTVPSVPPRTGNDSTASGQGQKQSDVRADAADTTPVPTTVTASRNKTSAVSSSPSASPTIQESFFKTVTKRLQLLESNTSLSLQYIEEQSRFLQDVLLKMERKQISRVDAFLDSLNKTVLSELRTVRTQYDQIWQSTVIALETQREQSQRDIAALSSRLNVLADEVVFQKRMAILQSVLLLSCLVLVIFSRGGLAALDSASFPAFPANHHNNHTTPPPSVYRRYGYDYDYTAGPGGLDMSASPPTRAAAEGRGRERPDYPSPSTPVTTKRSTSTLATSALPRHLYAAATTTSSSSSSSASVLRDKTLPLTPPSDVSFSRESTPTMRLDRSSSSSSSSSNHNNNIDGGSGPDGDAEVSSIEANPNPNPAAECARVSRPIREQGGAEEQDEQKEDEGEREKPPLARARSTVSHLGGLRKPLPALPEDPS